MTFIEAALKYANSGLYIFPVVPDAKTPLTRHGCKDATTEVSTIHTWWERCADANIALATGSESNIVVLDYDCKHNKPGLKTFESIQSRFSIETLSAETPSGGVHQFFRYPGAILRNSVDALPGMDIRTDGGYVVIAPSIVAGKPYRWMNRTQPAEMPEELISILIQPKTPPPPATSRPRAWVPSRLELIERARKYLDRVPGAVQGQAGDIQTYKLACRLVRGFDLSDDEALVLLLDWNRRCMPSWSERELTSKIQSARRNGVEPVGGKLHRHRTT